MMMMVMMDDDDKAMASDPKVFWDEEQGVWVMFYFGLGDATAQKGRCVLERTQCFLAIGSRVEQREVHAGETQVRGKSNRRDRHVDEARVLAAADQHFGENTLDLVPHPIGAT